MLLRGLGVLEGVLDMLKGSFSGMFVVSVTCGVGLTKIRDE